MCVTHYCQVANIVRPVQPEIIRWFADYQPFTPIIDTVRGLLLGTPIGWSGALAIGWCVAITIGSYLWAMRLYHRDPVPTDPSDRQSGRHRSGCGSPWMPSVRDNSPACQASCVMRRWRTELRVCTDTVPA
jgi:hypothetical protein